MLEKIIDSNFTCNHHIEVVACDAFREIPLLYDLCTTCKYCASLVPQDKNDLCFCLYDESTIPNFNEIWKKVNNVMSKYIDLMDKELEKQGLRYYFTIEKMENLDEDLSPYELETLIKQYKEKEQQLRINLARSLTSLIIKEHTEDPDNKKIKEDYIEQTVREKPAFDGLNMSRF